MRYLMLLMMLVPLTANASAVKYTWNFDMYAIPSGAATSVTGTMTINTDTGAVVNATAKSDLFDLVAGKGMIFLGSYNPDFLGYTGTAYINLVAKGDPSMWWSVNFYDFWVIPGMPLTKPLEALDSAVVIMNGWIDNRDTASNGPTWEIPNSGSLSNPVLVPEPGSVTLLAAGLMVWMRRRPHLSKRWLYL